MSQQRVPYQQVAVQTLEAVLVLRAPVVVVGSSQVVLLAVSQFATDAHDEDCSVLLADEVLALLRRAVGVHAAQFLAVDEEDVLGQEGLQLRIRLADVELGAQDSAVYLPYDALQVADVAVLGAHHSLPVPLVHVEAVQVVHLLVCADGIHVRYDAEARLDGILGQRHTLPLCQTMHHLGHCFAHILYGERYGALHSVQVVVNTKSAEHKERCCDATQAQLSAEAAEEEILYLLDGQFCLLQVEGTLIAFGFQ